MVGFRFSVVHVERGVVLLFCGMSSRGQVL